MIEHKIESRISGLESYHASSLTLLVPSAIAVAMLMLMFVTLDGPASAQEVDPASALRGSLGASLADLSISNHFGALSFLLNGGFALLCGALAILLVARTRLHWRARFGHQRRFFAFLFSPKRASAAGRHTGLTKWRLGG
jgi:hypothetical protein